MDRSLLLLLLLITVATLRTANAQAFDDEDSESDGSSAQRLEQQLPTDIPSGAFDNTVLTNEDPWFICFVQKGFPSSDAMVKDFNEASVHVLSRINFGIVDVSLNGFHLFERYNLTTLPQVALFLPRNKTRPLFLQGWVSATESKAKQLVQFSVQALVEHEQRLAQDAQDREEAKKRTAEGQPAKPRKPDFHEDDVELGSMSDDPKAKTAARVKQMRRRVAAMEDRAALGDHEEFCRGRDDCELKFGAVDDYPAFIEHLESQVADVEGLFKSKMKRAQAYRDDIYRMIDDWGDKVDRDTDNAELQRRFLELQEEVDPLHKYPRKDDVSVSTATQPTRRKTHEKQKYTEAANQAEGTADEATAEPSRASEGKSKRMQQQEEQDDVFDEYSDDTVHMGKHVFSGDLSEKHDDL